MKHRSDQSDPTDRSDLVALIRALPKTETHLHIEGALPIELLRRVRPEFKTPPASWAPNFKFRDFEQFEKELLDMVFAWYTSPERYHEAAKIIFARHLEQNVRYVETSFASGVVEFGGLNAKEILDAIRSAVPRGLDVRVFMGIHHNGAGPKMMPVLEAALGYKDLAGIDLHGTEGFPIEPWTAPYWAAARKAGKYTKAHAGEFMGAEFIRRILDELQPDRIEHGVRAVEDPTLVAELVKRRIGLDVCPISNHKLMPGVTLENHPIRQLLDAGVLVTISTDDPISFGNTLTDDYLALAKRRGFTRPELARIAKSGWEVAAVPASVRASMLTEIDRL